MTGASAKTVPAPYSVLVSGKGLQVRIYKRVNEPVSKLVLIKKITTIITATSTNNAQRFGKKQNKTEKEKSCIKKNSFWRQKHGIVWSKSDTQYWYYVFEDM